MKNIVRAGMMVAGVFASLGAFATASYSDQTVTGNKSGDSYNITSGTVLFSGNATMTINNDKNFTVNSSGAANAYVVATFTNGYNIVLRGGGSRGTIRDRGGIINFTTGGWYKGDADGATCNIGSSGASSSSYTAGELNVYQGGKITNGKINLGYSSYSANYDSYGGKLHIYDNPGTVELISLYVNNDHGASSIQLSDGLTVVSNFSAKAQDVSRKFNFTLDGGRLMATNSFDSAMKPQITWWLKDAYTNSPAMKIPAFVTAATSLNVQYGDSTPSGTYTLIESDTAVTQSQFGSIKFKSMAVTPSNCTLTFSTEPENGKYYVRAVYVKQPTDVYVTTEIQRLIWSNTLYNMTALAGSFGGTLAEGVSGPSICHAIYSNSVTKVQVQGKKENTLYCIKLEMKQNETYDGDVDVKALYAKSITGDYAVGVDFDTLAGASDIALATADDDEGLGLKGLSISGTVKSGNTFTVPALYDLFQWPTALSANTEKNGDGYFLCNFSSQTYWLTINAGRARTGTRCKVKVNAGGQLVSLPAANNSSCSLHYYDETNIAGSGPDGSGAIYFTGATRYGLRPVTLSDDASVGGYSWGMPAAIGTSTYLNLNGHTLSVNMVNSSQWFYIANTNYNGKIVVERGALTVFHPGAASNNVEIVVKPNGTFSGTQALDLDRLRLSGGTVNASNVILHGGISGAGDISYLKTAADKAVMVTPTNGYINVTSSMTLGSGSTLKIDPKDILADSPNAKKFEVLRVKDLTVQQFAAMSLADDFAEKTKWKLIRAGDSVYAVKLVGTVIVIR